MTGSLPQTAFLLSIAGVSIQVAAFAGLLAALRRGGRWKPIDVYRLRQIPEIGIATALIALATFALADTIGSARIAIQIASGVAVVFTASHIVSLFIRGRSLQAWWGSWGPRLLSISIDIGIFIAGAVSIIVGTAAAYEWLLILLLARQTLSFVLVLVDVASGEGSES